MKSRYFSFVASFAVAATLGFISLGNASAQTTQIRIDVEAPGAVAIAPSWGQFSATSNPLVAGGATATAGLELLAELGNPADLIGERGGMQLFGPLGGLTGNSSDSTVVSVNNTDNWFNYAAMILPSNDWFVGTGAQVPELDVSSLLGGAVGTSLNLVFTQVYDAGTEAEDFATAAPPGTFGFAASTPPAGAADPIDTIRLVDLSGANPFEAFANAPADVSALDFRGQTVATVTLTVVPEPGSLVGLLVIGGFGMLRRRR